MGVTYGSLDLRCLGIWMWPAHGPESTASLLGQRRTAGRPQQDTGYHLPAPSFCHSLPPFPFHMHTAGEQRLLFSDSLIVILVFLLIKPKLYRSDVAFKVQIKQRTITYIYCKRQFSRYHFISPFSICFEKCLHDTWMLHSKWQI